MVYGKQCLQFMNYMNEFKWIYILYLCSVYRQGEIIHDGDINELLRFADAVEDRVEIVAPAFRREWWWWTLQWTRSDFISFMEGRFLSMTNYDDKIAFDLEYMIIHTHCDK